MINIGFTGSRAGLSVKQKEKLRSVLLELLPRMRKFHHGDAIGADAEAHTIVGSRELARIEIHPSDRDSQRAWCKAPVIHRPMTPISRNKAIVKASDLVIACPSSMDEELRSGTWSTIRKARQYSKALLIIYPDGSTQREP